MRAAARTEPPGISNVGRAFLGLPSRRPSRLARARPASTLSRIRSRSNSAIDPRTPATSRPSGVLVSIPFSAAMPPASSTWPSRRCASGRTHPELVFPSADGTLLDDANRPAHVLPHPREGAAAAGAGSRSPPHVRVAADSTRREPRVRARSARPQIDPDHRRRVRSSGARRQPIGGRSPGRRATSCNPRATRCADRRLSGATKSWGISGEPGGNRTPNPQIKSLLLCQLSYRPDGESEVIGGR